MRLLIFDPQNQLDHTALSPLKIECIFNRIADSTDTASLVTALYVLPGVSETRGAYLRQWVTAANFRTCRGKWSFTQQFTLPAGLPFEFRLIRMRLDGRADLYPRQDRDAYGWAFTYQRFEDHLAALFAHELHHYRRYHLNLHPGEGEHGANRWALEQAVNKGYQVSGRKIRKKPLKNRRKRLFHLFDPFRFYRGLKTGDRLTIKTDPTGRYLNQQVFVVRPIRSNSKRIIIKTQDGKQWRWPMNWLAADIDRTAE